MAGLLAACGDGLGPDGPECAALGGDGSLSLAAGQLCTLLAADAANVELSGSPGTAEYLIAIQSGSRVPGATVSLRFEAEGVAPAASRAAPSRAGPRPVTDPIVRDEEWVSRAELRFRAGARRALRDARPLRATARPGGPPVRASVTAGGGLAVGDTIVFRNSVDSDLNVDCDGIHDVVTVVRALGSDFGIVEDIEAAGVVGESEYAEVLQALENLVFPVDTAYFGAPADLDGNGIVWMLFTPVVNRVTPRGSTSKVSGFFNPSDLADLQTCPASNRAELLYVLAPDPTGQFSDPVRAEFATTRAIGVAAHELEHLISAQQRVTLGGGLFADLEDAWLGEGLAHSAETAVGFMAAGLRPGDNLDFTAITADRASFEAYLFSNFRRAGFYFNDTNGTLALGDADGDDPGGVSSLEMRGFVWLLLRWLSDQEAPAGGLLGGPAEERLFRDLATGGPGHARGIANVERASDALGGPGDWADIVSRYALAPLADDAVGQAPASTQFTSFALRDVFAGLNAELQTTAPFEQPYPLLVSEVSLSANTDQRIDFDLGAATGRYVELATPGGAGAGHPPIRLALTTPSGALVPASARVRLVILRTR